MNQVRTDGGYNGSSLKNNDELQSISIFHLLGPFCLDSLCVGQFLFLGFGPKFFKEKSWFHFNIDNKYSYASLMYVWHKIDYKCVVLIVSLRHFDSKEIIIMYYIASEGLCHDVLMTKLRLRCIFPRAKLSEMRM